MSDRYLDNLLPDFGEYSLDGLLDSYQKRAEAPAGQEAPEPAQPAETAEAIAQRSRQIIMEALGETLSQHRKIPDLDFGEDDLAELDELLARPGRTAAPAGDAGKDTEEEATAPEPKRRSRVHVSEDGVITMDVELPVEEVEPEERPEPDHEPDAPEAEEEPARRLHVVPPEEPASKPTAKERLHGMLRRQREPKARKDSGDSAAPAGPSARDRFLMPLVRMAATRLARRQMQKAEAANWPDPVEYRETEELPPKKASKFYGQQLRPLRFRCRVCFFLCLILTWISMGFPMAGVLGKSLAVQAGVSLMLLATVMMATLDILAAGARQLFDLRPGAEALALLSALLSCVDAGMVMSGYGSFLPFCAVGAISLTAALWGEKLDCLARARTMRAAAVSHTPSAVTAGDNGRGGRYICRSQRPVEGIVRRSEEADLCRTVYGTAAPILLLVSLALAVLASLNGRGAYFLHTLSALLSVSASFSAFFSFPLPYCLTAGKLQNSGAAIVGYAGAASIGKARRVVISDSDLFPPGTMKLTAINILEGAPVEKVVADTTCLLSASGSGVTGVFMELMARRKYAMPKPEEFRCHEGGGLSARVDGEQVLVGSAGFMNLMGIRLPQNMTVRNAICTAISGELMAVFNLEYTPVSSVQDALVTLLQGHTQPIFAIRDFNITPLMIRHLFRMPTDNFNFPTFRDRYRIAASAAGMDDPIAAVLSRGGMGPMVDAAEAGRKLYGACRIGAVLSLAGTVIGLVTMFLLCRAGSYDTATAGNVLSYMLLWALPAVIVAVGQCR